MGYVNGTIVHYWAGDETECETFLITLDHAPDYGLVVSGVTISAGTEDGAPGSLVTRLDVTHDQHERGPKQTHTVKRAADTWHTLDECPERFNPENVDRRPPREPGPPIIIRGEPDRERVP